MAAAPVAARPDFSLGVTCDLKKSSPNFLNLSVYTAAGASSKFSLNGWPSRCEAKLGEWMAHAIFAASRFTV
eukprot:CAMPEP_0176145510 /NCGR_PEP_ID=MMETSP0120_2-20121206/74121_1 /TAXON_ID=160619 /ORGANISM="Kryptoperidinium foliaceum, Strain CCMP 1326" /LENGTH=71 /DNA_ID=CAMNT_0017481975 /DNA_START=1 /DNA_END=213 /DNA_ORIENTATION=+